MQTQSINKAIQQLRENAQRLSEDRENKQNISQWTDANKIVADAYTNKAIGVQSSKVYNRILGKERKRQQQIDFIEQAIDFGLESVTEQQQIEDTTSKQEYTSYETSYEEEYTQYEEHDNLDEETYEHDELNEETYEHEEHGEHEETHEDNTVVDSDIPIEYTEGDNQEEDSTEQVEIEHSNIVDEEHNDCDTDKSEYSEEVSDAQECDIGEEESNTQQFSHFDSNDYEILIEKDNVEIHNIESQVECENQQQDITDEHEDLSDYEEEKEYTLYVREDHEFDYQENFGSSLDIDNDVYTEVSHEDKSDVDSTEISDDHFGVTTQDIKGESIPEDDTLSYNIEDFEDNTEEIEEDFNDTLEDTFDNDDLGYEEQNLYEQETLELETFTGPEDFEQEGFEQEDFEDGLDTYEDFEGDYEQEDFGMEESYDDYGYADEY